ncbi:MAG: amidase family protein, partial [Pseudomonadota bacterium]
MPGIEQRVRERLDLIASRDREVNSFIRVDHDEALAAARLADASMAGTPRGLAGLTFAAKDNIAVEGKP